MKFDYSKSLFYVVLIGAFVFVCQYTFAEPISIPPDYVITSPTGNVEIGVSSRYGGAIVYYKDFRIPDKTVANGNIIDYSNGGTLLSTPIWTLPNNPQEQQYCWLNQKGTDGKCKHTLPFNNPTQGGYLGDGHAGNPNPVDIKIVDNKILVSYRSVNYNYGYGAPAKPMTQENESEWQTDFWGDVEISFHPTIKDVVVVDTKITYCKDNNPRCAGKDIKTQDNQLSTLFAAGSRHPDPHFRGPYTRTAFISATTGKIISEALPYFSDEPSWSDVGVDRGSKNIQSPEGWIGLIQSNNSNGVGMAIERMQNDWLIGGQTAPSLFNGGASFPLYSANGWPVVTGSRPLIYLFETDRVSTGLGGNYTFEPQGWYKFRTYFSTGDINDVRYNLRKSLNQVNDGIQEPDYEGYVDTLSCTDISGWAHVKGDSTPKTIKAVLTSLNDSRIKNTFVSTNEGLRPDLSQICADGKCAFSVPISDVGRGMFRADVFINDGNKDLLLRSDVTIMGPCHPPQVLKFEPSGSGVLTGGHYFSIKTTRDVDEILIYADYSSEPIFKNKRPYISEEVTPLNLLKSTKLKVVVSNRAGSTFKEIFVSVAEPKFKMGDIVRLDPGARQFGASPTDDFGCSFLPSRGGKFMKVDADKPLYRTGNGNFSPLHLWKLSLLGIASPPSCLYFEESEIEKIDLGKKVGDEVELKSDHPLWNEPRIKLSIANLKKGTILKLIDPMVLLDEVVWKVELKDDSKEGYIPDSVLEKIKQDSVPVGSLLTVNCEEISGWAYDPDTPSESLAIHIYEGGAGVGKIISNLITDIEDKVLNGKFKITGNHVFGVATPDSIKDGKSYSIYAYAINSKIDGLNPELSGSGQTIKCGEGQTQGPVAINFFKASSNVIKKGESVELKWEVENAQEVSVSPLGSVSGDSIAVSPDKTTTYVLTASGGGKSVTSSLEIKVEESEENNAPNIKPVGSLDAANCDVIGGWAYDPNTPNSELSIHIYQDGAGVGPLISAISTTGLRSDVNGAFKISGNHGFTISTPSNLKDGKSKTIRAYAIDSSLDPNSNIELPGSPKVFTCNTNLGFFRSVTSKLKAAFSLFAN